MPCFNCLLYKVIKVWRLVSPAILLLLLLLQSALQPLVGYGLL